MDSILTSVKKMLGITDEYTQFDVDIIMHINSVFAILTQLGIGPPNGFVIKSKLDAWSMFVSEDDPRFEPVKSYMYMKVRLLFDPPQSSIVMESMKAMIDELEWRLNWEYETSQS